MWGPLCAGRAATAIPSHVTDHFYCTTNQAMVERVGATICLPNFEEPCRRLLGRMHKGRLSASCFGSFPAPPLKTLPRFPALFHLRTPPLRFLFRFLLCAPSENAPAFSRTLLPPDAASLLLVPVPLKGGHITGAGRHPVQGSFSSKSCSRQVSSARFCASPTSGYCGSRRSRVSTTTSETSRRANHFLSAGMTYQGAALEAV